MVTMLMYFITLSLFELTIAVRYYVNADISHSGNGASWAESFKTLDEALIAATNYDDIWLTMSQEYKITNTEIRSECFHIPKGVSIYGGFIGNENYISERPSAKDTKLETRLSGDINEEKKTDDNCYHVITYNEELTLDGLTISDGNANLENYADQTEALHKYGGAIITLHGSKSTQLYLNNVKFLKNYALAGGALWFMAHDILHGSVNAVIMNCLFHSNSAITGQYEGGYGGAIYTYFYANVTVSNTKFVQNKAEYRGGAIYQDYGGIFSCDGCAFIKNEAKHGYGGGIFSEDRNSQTEGT
eukprot:509150_1